jgi:hypothetical protein
MQHSDLRTMICDQFGEETPDNPMKARVTRYINFIQQDIASRAPMAEFLLKRYWFQCTTPYTTGTVYASGTTLTGVGTTFTSAMVGRKIRIGGESEYYTISAFTSTTVVTLDQAYMGTYDTLAEATAYSIYQDEYSLTSDVEKIICFANPTLSDNLIYESRQSFNARVPNPTGEGTPDVWVPAGRDTSDYVKIQLSPIPGEAYVIYYWYRRKLADLSGDTDVSDIPVKYHRLLYLGGLAMLYEWDGNDQSNNEWAKYENLIIDMKKDLETGSEDSIIVLGSVDEAGGPGEAKLPPAHFAN